MNRIAIALLLTIFAAFGMVAQPVSGAKSSAADDVFSGTVTASASEAVTVVRKVPAKPDESRIFVVDKNTIVEGNLKVSARVTVRFAADGEGAVHALRIIVRTDVKSTGGGSSKTPPPPAHK